MLDGHNFSFSDVFLIYHWYSQSSSGFWQSRDFSFLPSHSSPRDLFFTVSNHKKLRYCALHCIALHWSFGWACFKPRRWCTHENLFNHSSSESVRKLLEFLSLAVVFCCVKPDWRLFFISHFLAMIFVSKLFRCCFWDDVSCSSVPNSFWNHDGFLLPKLLSSYWFKLLNYDK